MKATTIGIDLAKNVFQLHGVDGHGKVVLKKQMKREQTACRTRVARTCSGRQIL
ncbi:hypothetical protein J2776_002781 [Paraburkholderia caledonica]|uniref:IS110 family transposase n=1 Tax=Paraburkholderia caledonica TaxID=134536 RepID=A0ABU1KYN4_9BURK|nr:hypothetical protein [Paraburkholderia caledonica]